MYGVLLVYGLVVFMMGGACIVDVCSTADMFLFGLTGGIASGKSTVAAVLSDLGCSIVDADIIAREVVEPGRSAWKMIVKNFGRDILLEDGHIDRQKLGQIVFQDEAKRKILNRCTHPYIQRAMLWKVVKHFLRGESFVVLVSPLLYESGRFLSALKKIIVVDCSHEQQVERLMARDNLSETEALQRINAQMPLSEKCRRADFIVDNTNGKDLTRQHTYTLFATMQRLSYRQKMLRRLLLTLVGLGIVYIVFNLLFS